MIEKLKKIKENKILKIIGNLLYALLLIFVVLMLLVVIMQRVTNNNIAIGGFRMFSVATGSMVPEYQVGDILLSKEIKPEKIEVGDDIVYIGESGTFKGKMVTHRVISIERQEDGNYKIITKGIANSIQDPEINQEQVYGKVICNFKILGWIGKIVRNIYAFYIIAFLPVGILVYKNIKNIASGKCQEEYIKEEDYDEEDYEDEN